MNLSNAQKRAIDDLKERGIAVYIDKGGRIRHSQMPIMNLHAMRIVDKSSLTEAMEEIEATREAHKMVMAEKCPGDEVHCTCVPFLRAEINGLRKHRMIQEELISSNYEYIAKLHKERMDSINIETCPTKLT